MRFDHRIQKHSNTNVGLPKVMLKFYTGLYQRDQKVVDNRWVAVCPGLKAGGFGETDSLTSTGDGAFEDCLRWLKQAAEQMAEFHE